MARFSVADPLTPVAQALASIGARRERRLERAQRDRERAAMISSQLLQNQPDTFTDEDRAFLLGAGNAEEALRRGAMLSPTVRGRALRGEEIQSEIESAFQAFALESETDAESPTVRGTALESAVQTLTRAEASGEITPQQARVLKQRLRSAPRQGLAKRQEREAGELAGVRREIARLGGSAEPPGSLQAGLEKLSSLSREKAAAEGAPSPSDLVDEAKSRILLKVLEEQGPEAFMAELRNLDPMARLERTLFAGLGMNAPPTPMDDRAFRARVGELSGPERKVALADRKAFINDPAMREATIVGINDAGHLLVLIPGVDVPQVYTAAVTPSSQPRPRRRGKRPPIHKRPTGELSPVEF